MNLRSIGGILVASLFAAAASPAAEPGLPSAARVSPRPSSVGGLGACLLPLDGEWRFHPSPPERFWTLAGRDFAAWKTIRVPGDWSMQGFSVAQDSAAAYARTFDVPPDWRGRRILLRCDSVQSDAEIWINGRAVAGHQGGFTAFERDVTATIEPGRPNTIALAVKNESVADQLASGTQYAAYQFGGITRKIYLLAVPEVHLSAFEISTDVSAGTKGGTLRIAVEVANEGTRASEQLSVGFRLADSAGKRIGMEKKDLAFPEVKPGERVRRIFETRVAAADWWDAERPNLYALTAELGSAKALLETVVQKIGFRSVRVSGNKVLVNGSPIRVRGVNRHETHPLLGRSLTPELWRRDAELFRGANVNLIRTSHYPPAEEFLDACDELGLFVECEAPLVWVGHGGNAKWQKEAPHDPRWLPYLRQAVAEMIAFHRNHPSIIFWSLANESAWGPNWKETLRLAEAMDPTRPKTFHDQAVGSYNNLGSTDLPVANYHYPDKKLVADLANYSRPIYYGEYTHINCYNRTEIAADPGVRDEYGRGLSEMWEAMVAAPSCLGGSIWSGIDDIFYLPSGKVVGYGDWGLIDGWRREKPEYWNVKKVYSPVKVKTTRVEMPRPGGSIAVRVENRHDFTDLRELEITWRTGGEVGIVRAEVGPRSAGSLSIRPRTRPAPGSILRLEFRNPRGFLIDASEIAIGEAGPEAGPEAGGSTGGGPAMILREGAAGVPAVIEDGGYLFRIDKAGGRIIGASAAGAEVLAGGPELMILPLTSGPCVTDYNLDIKPLNSVLRNWKTSSSALRREGGTVVLSARGKGAEASGSYEIRFAPGGRVDFSYDFAAAVKINPRQIGLVVHAPKALSTLAWKRRSLWSVYPEDHIGRTEGEARAFEGTPFAYRAAPMSAWKDDRNELGSNDFRSTKQNVLRAELHASDGRGIRLDSDGRHSVRAFEEKDGIGFLVADFTTGGGDMFYAGHHRDLDRPLSPGDRFRGSFTLHLVPAGRR